MKRVLSVLLVLVMLVGLVPGGLTVRAAEHAAREERMAQELPGASRLQDRASEAEQLRLQPADDELVTVIVELETPALMDGYVPSASVMSADQTAGEALSDYLTSASAAAEEAKLLQNQESLFCQIQDLSGLASPMSAEEEGPLAQWTTIFNGMALQVPAGLLPEIRELPGVRSAHVEQVYARPEPVIGQDRGSIYGYSYDMVGLGEAWKQGYTGRGMLVAVLDSGLDITYADGAVTRVHEAFTDNSFCSAEENRQLRYTDNSLRLLLNSVQLHAATGLDGEKLVYPHNDLYKNSKVPFAYDYVGDGSLGIPIGDLDVQPTTNDHGTHVCGTIAGYAADDEGKVRFSGIAPDAQLMMFKVFPDLDGGAPETALLNALEDAMILGADVVNLSLGSDNGFPQDDSSRIGIYDRLQKAGILVMAAAGNSGASTSNNLREETTGVEDPEIAMVSSPAVYAPNLAVASIENSINTETTLTWSAADGQPHQIAFLDPKGIVMKNTLGGQEPLEVIAVDGVGSFNDFNAADFQTDWGGSKVGIALVQRGEITFTQKAQNAQWFKGVKGILIYDNNPSGTELINMGLEDVNIPAAFINGVDGAALAAACKAGKVTMTVQTEDHMIENEHAGEMSSFTSWGAGPGLELKPEITAPGGNIWSTVLDKSGAAGSYTGSYAMMSGTSMATPHMSGLSALVEQYVRTGLNMTDKALASYLTNHLLVSTAVPQKDPRGSYYSPRLQGAGLANVGAAVSTPAYIAVDNQLVGKLELKDDPEWTGSFDLDFRVENLTTDQLHYDISAVILVPGVEDTTASGKAMSTLDRELATVDLGTIDVPAGGAAFHGSLTLTAEQISTLKASFPNGTYVEGFIFLNTADSSCPTIGLPYLGFLGDWTTAPILDRSWWIDAPADGESVWNNSSSWGTSYVNSAWIVEGTPLLSLTLGQNLFDPAADNQQRFHEENIGLSPNGDGVLDTINDFTIYQLRDAKAIVFEVRDAETNELYFRDCGGNMFKTTYNPGYSQPIPTSWYGFTPTYWDGTDLEGKVLPDGTQCICTLTAFNDGEYPLVQDANGHSVTDYAALIPGEKEPAFNGHAMDKTGDTKSFRVTIDNEAPLLDNSAVRIYRENDRTYLTGTFHDVHGSLASIEVLPLVEYTPLYSDKAPYVDTDGDNPFLVEQIYDPAAKTFTFTADVTEYTGEGSYENDVRWTGTVYVYGGDYAGNDRGYAVEVNADEGIQLSHRMMHLYVGESFDLLVNNNVDGESILTRTSDHPEVASIDEFGHVEGLTPGQAVITVSNGTAAEICMVAVEERPTKLQDFRLTPDTFTGLKPDGTYCVMITDIQPSNIDLSKLENEITVTCPDEAHMDLVGWDVGDDGMSIFVNLKSSTAEPKDGSSCEIEVTIDGITRKASFTWEDLYEKANDDDLVPDFDYDQIVFINQGETAELVAKYNNGAAHKFVPVAQYTLKDYVDYGDNNSTEPGEGLLLDGPGFAPVMGQWSGKLVNKEGYALPETIRVFERYSYDGGESFSESEKRNNAWRTYFTYDKETGEITIPDGATMTDSTLVIRADGVAAPGSPAGTLSGVQYPVPDLPYGPFDWTVTEGNGALETKEGVEIEYKKVNAAYYTPAEPGVSYIRAASKDGRFTLNYAVVSLAVQAETITLSAQDLVIRVGETAGLTADLQPQPSLEEDAGLQWTSFDETVAAVAQDGTVTGVAPGYAYVQAVTAGDAQVRAGCIVRVLPAQNPDPDPDPDPHPTPDPDPKPNPPHKPTLPENGEAQKNIRFDDLPESHWAYPTVMDMVDRHYVNGVSDTLFAPNGAMTRAMLVTILWRMEGEPQTAYTGRFRDVADGQWYTTAVEWAAANGVVNGYGDDFAPNANVTREQIATILWRLSGSKKTAGKLDSFRDAASVSSYAAEAVTWAVAQKLLQGSDGMLRPGASATRAEAVTLLYRYLEQK